MVPASIGKVGVPDGSVRDDFDNDFLGGGMDSKEGEGVLAVPAELDGGLLDFLRAERGNENIRLRKSGCTKVVG